MGHVRECVRWNVTHLGLEGSLICKAMLSFLYYILFNLRFNSFLEILALPFQFEDHPQRDG